MVFSSKNIINYSKNIVPYYVIRNKGREYEEKE